MSVQGFQKEAHADLIGRVRQALHGVATGLRMCVARSGLITKRAKGKLERQSNRHRQARAGGNIVHSACMSST